jgi:3-hydroxyacyl-[acyl-carrier-protein] dehydratase
MPPPPIIEPQSIDLTQCVADRSAIHAVNPHRHEFELLDAVTFFDRQTLLFAGYFDVRPDDWWTRGHVPGRPLFPGVLMIESAAQLSSYIYHQVFPESGKFIGFAGVNHAKFRGAAEPPCRLVLAGRGRQLKPRRVVTDIQGFIDNTMVFEVEITGMPV